MMQKNIIKDASLEKRARSCKREEVRTLKKVLTAIIVLCMMLVVTNEIYARGTDAGTVISNLSCTIKFSNSNGVINSNNANIVTNIVTNAHDLSIVNMISPVFRTNGPGTALTWDLGDVTNWGNLTDSIIVSVQTNGVFGTNWTPCRIIIITNGVAITSNDNVVSWTNNNLSSDSVINDLAVMIRINSGVSNGSTNNFMIIVENGAGAAGDSWPGVNAIAPSTPDVGNARDCQTNYAVAVVAGPVMSITKSIISGAGQVKPYDIITYRIHYTNSGGDVAEGVSIVDVIPLDTILETNSATATPGAISIDTYSMIGPAWIIGNDYSTMESNTNVLSVRWVLSNTDPGDAGDVEFSVRVR